MVEEILENINQKVNQELSKIKSEKEMAVLELEKKYEKETEKQKQASLKEFKEKVESEIQEFSEKKRTETDFVILQEKNKIIGEAYEKAVEKIFSLPAKELEKWIKSYLPEKVEGKIIAGEKTMTVLKKIVNNKIEKGSEEGFLIVNDEIELDFRISEILKQLKEKQGPEVNKRLCLNTQPES